ncbi:hypothetical protein [Tessaracoccus sp. OS52]|uniref:rhamnogalacturonan lyase family protein n=1 Tax=Tessaracoccus sp. OS52 TaxID=2886691 RepID=UPI0027295E56|nr:hypothetical protein [Tessaracoccus sp. OS52]
MPIVHPRAGAPRRTAALAAAAALALGGLTAAPAVAQDPPLSFDFNCATSPTADGHVGVLPNVGYTIEQGYGFDAPLAANACRDRGGDDAAARDFALPPAGTVFRADVPNGTYTIVFRTGDYIASSNSGLTVEGRSLPNQGVPSGQVANRVLDDVVVADGQLTFTFSGSSLRLNAIEIHEPLSAPTSLAATVDAATPHVALSWDAADGAAAYRVYRQEGSADAQVLAETDTNSWTDTTVALGREYTYTVVSVGTTGLVSPPTAPVTVEVVDPDAPAPATPTGLTAAWSGEQIALQWQPVDGAVAYDVFRATGGREPVFETRVTEPAWTDAAAVASADHSYQVAAVGLGGISERTEVVTVEASVQYARQAERIDRAPVAVATDDGVYVGWRLLGDDDADLAFHVYRDGRRVTDEPVVGSTNFLDAEGDAAATYRISAVQDVERWVTQEFEVWDEQYLDVPLQRPAGGTNPDGTAYEYRANDASVGDIDGDGTYELVLKWDPTNSQDNSRAGFTGNVYIDAYEFDGTQLWRLDLGRNIRAGAHYTQFQVFDYDGDGRAEVALKTADGTVDGEGTVIGDASADHRNSGGYVLAGPEFLTIFDGQSGAAIDTVDYIPPRGTVSAWGDGYGNRVDRFLAGTAYFDGQTPSLVTSRGYYTRTVIAAWDFDGENLQQRWVFDSNDAGSAYTGQGNHQFSVADVDSDQLDEIVFGSMTIDDDGSVLYNTGLGHGDALHVADFDPERPGLEVFAAHESMSASGNRGATFRDAATGEVIWSIPATRDTGRAAMADIDPRYTGAEGWAVGGDAAWNSPVGQLKSSDGELISEQIPAANHLVWWDGDLLREILDHDFDQVAGLGVPTIAKWDWETATEQEIYRADGTRTNNHTKGNPSLQADLFGDWREEVVTPLTDSSALRIHTTLDLTDVRLRTLMSDPVYRLGVAWQNTAYNQPPHTSFYLGDGMGQPEAPVLDYVGGDPAPGEPVPLPVDLQLAVATQCTGPLSMLRVSLTNVDDVPVTASVETAYGTKAFDEVGPGQTKSLPFQTKQKALPAGEVTITATATIDGDPVTFTQTATYESQTC